MDLNGIWFLLVSVLFAGYALLDGFDLGVGILHLFHRDEHARRVGIGAIGPVWDGNEVWLLTAGGALFAAFPPVYAAVFSGFYLALMLVLLALIFRAVSLEYRRLVDNATWRRCWDWAFGLGSLLIALLLGVALGNILRGIPLNEAGDPTGTFLGLLNGYAILVGLLAVAGFVQHGAVYMTLKSDGELQSRMGRVALRAWGAVAILLVVVIAASRAVAPFLFDKPAALVPVAVLLAAVILLPVFLKRGCYGKAFLASSGIVVGAVATVAVALFPRLVPSSTDLTYSLTAYNASSTPRSLFWMLLIALIGVPVVLVYTSWVYWMFRGKADTSYADDTH